MSGLRAEKRLDKNGRLVTRHVQNGDTPPSPAKRLPSVLGMLRKDDRFPGRTKETLEYPLGMVSASERRKIMRTLNDDTMRALYQIGVGADTARLTGSETEFRTVVAACRDEGSFALLNNIAFFAKDNGREEHISTMHKFVGMVKGLAKYQQPGTPRLDYTTASEEELDDARKLLAVGESLKYHLGSCMEMGYDRYTGSGQDYLKSPAAVEAFRSLSYEKALEFAQFIKGKDLWFNTDDEVRNAVELFAIGEETHDALDDGIL